MFNKTLLLISFQFLLWSIALAQPSSPAPLKLGIGLSSFSYTGDLIESGDQFRRFYPGGNFSIQFAGKSALKMQVNAGFGRFAEQADVNLWPGNLAVIPNNFVETSLFYIDLRAKYWFFKDRKLRPFIGGGAGILFFNPRDKDGNLLSENIFTRLPGEDYNTNTFNFPLSAGLEMEISPQINLGLEYIYRFTMTDYLDNIGQLGPVQGNDGLHAIQVNLFFTLNSSPKPALKPKEEPLPELPVVVEVPSVGAAGVAEVSPPANLFPPLRNEGWKNKSKKSSKKD